MTEPVGGHIVADAVAATSQIIIDPAKTHSVSSFFVGQIDQDLVQIGDRVTEGQDLVRLKSREVAEVIAAYIKASSRYESASLLYEREKELRSTKLTTEEAYLTAQAAYREALASRTASLQTALLARSREDLMSIVEGDGVADMTHLSIQSVLAGTVIEKMKYAGEAVETNQELFKIANTTNLLVEIQVPLQAAAMVRSGDVLMFHTVVGEQRTGEVTVSKISPIVSQESLSLRVFGTLDNAKGEWLAGTPVNVSVIDSRAPKVIAG